MTILVTGANGQLGTCIREACPGAGDKYIFSDVGALAGQETLSLDITNPEAVRIVVDSEKVDAIINCAAYTDVERAEGDPAMADLLNHQAVKQLAAICAEKDLLLVHISTDYVFPGNRPEPYREEDAVGPTGVYGATKLRGEQVIEKSGCRYLIFRTSWLYSPYGKNFVKTMARLTAERDILRVVYDQVGSPTYAGDLAELIVKVLSGRKFPERGLYHFSGEGAVSWYDFAQAIAELCGHDCRIQPCRSADYPSKVRRPAYSVLDKAKVKAAFGVEIPYWRDSLKKCLERLNP